MINLLTKGLVFVLLGWVLHKQLLSNDSAPQLWQAFKENLQWRSAPWLLAALFLMPINWAFETLKWQVLMKDVEQLSFWKAFQAILAGATFSVFTPNRIGEYGGRILLVSVQNNAKAVVATVVGSFAQLVVLLGIGAFGMAYFAYHALHLSPLYMQGIVFLSMLLVAMLLFCYFNVRYFTAIVFKFKTIRRFIKPLLVLRHYHFKQLSSALGWAGLRYLVYSLQYLMVLRFFGSTVGAMESLAAIATIFLLQTSIPLPPLMSLFVRGEVALQVWSYFGLNQLGILSATLTLWALNLIIPAIFGAIVIFNVNIAQSWGLFKK